MINPTERIRHALEDLVAMPWERGGLWLVICALAIVTYLAVHGVL